MKKTIQILLSAAVLATASSSVLGRTIDDALNTDSPRYERPIDFTFGSICDSDGGFNVEYKTHPINHTGGVLDIQLNSDDFDTVLGLHSATFDPLDPCATALEYNDNGGIGGANEDSNSVISLDLPSGPYVIIATAFNRDIAEGAYTLIYTSSEAPSQPVSVPVAGIPALALGSLSLIGAAGFVSRRRKAKAENA